MSKRSLLVYFPINTKFIIFLEEKNHENPPHIFFKYIPKTDAGMRYARLTDYEPICPCLKLNFVQKSPRTHMSISPMSGLGGSKDQYV